MSMSEIAQGSRISLLERSYLITAILVSQIWLGFCEMTTRHSNKPQSFFSQWTLWLFHTDQQHRQEQTPREQVSIRALICGHRTPVPKDCSAVSHILTCKTACHQIDALTFTRWVTQTNLSSSLILSRRKEIFSRSHTWTFLHTPQS